VLALAVTADGGVVISGARDCTARLWDPGSGKEIRALLGHERPVTAVAITPDGRVAASGDEGGVVRAWDAANGACLASFRGEDAIKTCTLSPDGRVISAAEASGKMYFLEIRAA
jgi:WD40 repeat protein